MTRHETPPGEKPKKGPVESVNGWGEWFTGIFDLGDMIEFGIDAVKLIAFCALAVVKFLHHFIH